MAHPTSNLARAKRERKLPVQQLSILAICRFAEPLASTSLYPYLPEMVESFNVPQNEVGKWAGACAAIFSLFQALMGIPWGRFADRYGRKPAILLGLASTMFTSLLWGFSKSLPVAILARALAGMGNGNVGIIRTTVAEMVPFKELQPRAFSLMPLVWNVGSIFGPTIGGALANPYNVKPGEVRERASLLEVFPYALPNIVSASFFAVGITVGLLFLEETLEGADHRRDYGLRLGSKLTGLVKSHVLKLEEMLHLRAEQNKTQANGTAGESDPLLNGNGKAIDDEEDNLPYETKPKLPRPGWREVLNKQAVINLVVYTLLAMHGMAFDQLMPVYMQHRPIGREGSTPYSPPLKFAGGFGLNHWEIGLISTCYGVLGMFVQFFLFPPLARRFGVLFWLKVVACSFPVVYFLTPFTALLPTKQTQVGCMFTIMSLKCLCGIFAFPCSTILLTNSANSLRTLGTLNGIATSVSAIGRAAGPAMAGAIFSVGVKRGYVIAPWWFLSALSIVAAIPVFWLVEGEGFGGDDEVSDEETEDEVAEDFLQTAALEGEAENAGKPGPILPPSQDGDEEHEERAYGGLASLSRTNTTASTALLSDHGDDAAGPASPSLSRRASGYRTGDDEDSANRTLSRRNSRRTMHKMSIPIGMGRGISRRYSSNLGQSYGSAGGYQ
ncbi:MFS transporter-like protein [Dothistroma septosporum NZE10]|uniref:MFS transporter-like protein n=1 Tax=Dothistroma septosporum (strain NZE10 / CBS 128990) TaxID=675120 RepID=N1PXG3_DOTSN|nr:MFS transporter-like protein [Dothistroma septosporum NZE10]